MAGVAGNWMFGVPRVMEPGLLVSYTTVAVCHWSPAGVRLIPKES